MQRNVSDLSIVGLGENEKQMLDSYAEAVSSFWRTNRRPRIRQGVGWHKDSRGGTNSNLGLCVCVCVQKHKNVGA